jgi:hypothetical protein
MSDQTTSTTHGRGPVAPPKPDVSAFGRRSERGRRLAAAQRGSGHSGATNSAAGSGDVNSDVPTPTQEEQTAPSGPEKPEAAGSSVLDPVETAVAPTATAEHLASDTATDATENVKEVPDPASDPAEAPEPPDTSSPDGSVTASPDERPTGAEEDQADDDEFWVGKATKQSWVPDAIAARFHRLQDSGKTAETIVLTAVGNCSERLPELIKAARGPVHEDGLFPGLPVIERGPARKKNDRRNSARIQYQVSPKFRPALERVAKQHRLKLSVLVRLALGDYFGIPVRIDRVK